MLFLIGCFVFILALIFFFLILPLKTFLNKCNPKKNQQRNNRLFINEPLQVRMIRNENLRNLNIPGDEPLEI